MNKFEALQILGLSGLVTKQDIKKAYKLKAKEFHPDHNPAGNEIMKMINVAYELVKDEDSINVFVNSAISNYPKELASALSAIKNLHLNIEICGLWIWISGDTKTHKDILKASHYHWSPKKNMWYYRPNNAKGRKRFSNDKSEWSIERIRQTFGASYVHQRNSTQLIKYN